MHPVGTPNSFACFAFNAVMAAAHVLTAMMLEPQPIYVNSPNYAEEFMYRVKRYRGPGAGIDIAISTIEGGFTVLP